MKGQAKEFDKNYVFIPLAFRKLYGDDGIVPMQNFQPLSHQVQDEVEALAGDLQAQFNVIEELAADYMGSDPDFSQLTSRDEYEHNLVGCDCDNIDGGNSEWNGVVIAAYDGYAPKHFVVGIEVAGRIERTEKPIEGILVWSDNGNL